MSLKKKLDKLLESYLEEIIDTESYQKKKEELLEQKQILREKIEEIKTKGSSWLEPLKEFIKEAADAAKIARAKNSGGAASAAPELARGVSPEPDI